MLMGWLLNGFWRMVIGIGIGIDNVEIVLIEVWVVLSFDLVMK